jgi:hypothetical protein
LAENQVAFSLPEAKCIASLQMRSDFSHYVPA